MKHKSKHYENEVVSMLCPRYLGKALGPSLSVGGGRRLASPVTGGD